MQISPLSYSFSHTESSYRAVVTAISSLLFPCCPNNVPRLVALIVMNTL